MRILLLMLLACATPIAAQGADDDLGTLAVTSPVQLEYTHYLVVPDEELDGLTVEHSTAQGIRYTYRFRSLSSLMAPASSSPAGTVQIGSTWSWGDEMPAATVFAGGPALAPWPDVTWAAKGMVYTRWTSKNSQTCALEEHEVCTEFELGDSARTTARLHQAQVEALQEIYPAYED